MTNNDYYSITLQTPHILPLSCLRHLFLHNNFFFKTLIDIASKKITEDDKLCLRKKLYTLNLKKNIVIWLDKNHYTNYHWNIIESCEKSIFIRKHCFNNQKFNMGVKSEFYAYMLLLIDEYIKFFKKFNTTKMTWDVFLLEFYKHEYMNYKKKEEFDTIDFQKYVNPLIYYNYKIISSFQQCKCIKDYTCDNPMIIIPYISDYFLNKNTTKLSVIDNMFCDIKMI
jgi:hypothetical protein